MTAVDCRQSLNDPAVASAIDRIGRLGETMLNRDHIEFIQAQLLPWLPAEPDSGFSGCEIKLLSADAENGGCSLLIRYPHGWSRRGATHQRAAEEFYVLEGSLRINGEAFTADSYSCRPPGWSETQREANSECVVLAFFDRKPELVAGSGDGSAESSSSAVHHINAREMAWDLSLNDPKLAHLGIGRKNLRTDPDTGERTFLSLALPQSIPPGNKGPQERHPVVEEAYLLGGSLTGPQGTMYPGAYFWRPPDIVHGPFGSRWGSVALIRFVGGRHVNQWSQEEVPFCLDTPYKPILPPALRKLVGITH
jgi:Domain of unknown function (DUF4437)